MKKEDPNQVENCFQSFEQHEGRYGYRRIHAELRAKDIKLIIKKYSEL